MNIFQGNMVTATAAAQIITGVLGSGVLMLAWTMAQLGWIAGPLSMMAFVLLAHFAAIPLLESYASPETETSPARNCSFKEAVQLHLGGVRAWCCAVIIRASFFMTCVSYIVSSATSMRAVQKSNCYHKHGHETDCESGSLLYAMMFVAAQLLMSQILNFQNMEWVSVGTTVMSFAYSFIAMGLSMTKVIGNGFIAGDIAGISSSSPLQKMWLISEAYGRIVLAYPYAILLIEIQDTLGAPVEIREMKRVAAVSLIATTGLYLGCGLGGYAAFGDSTPRNLLTGFGFYEPYWFIDLANVCLVIHLMGGYQVYSQRVFAAVERWVAAKFPDSNFVNAEYELSWKLPWFPAVRFNGPIDGLGGRDVRVGSVIVVALLHFQLWCLIGLDYSVGFGLICSAFRDLIWMVLGKYVSTATGEFLMTNSFYSLVSVIFFLFAFNSALSLAMLV